MAKENGGVIGIINTPTSTTASGVWALQDQYEAKRNSNWPLTPFVSPNSARFNSGSSDNLTRTPATTGTSRRIMTFSFWTKRSGFETTNAYRLFSTFYTSGANQFWIRFADSGEGINKLSIVSYTGSAFKVNIQTTQVFRDPSAWYHFVVAFDTTQATSTDRVKVYVNGSQITSFSGSTYPTQNQDLEWNVTQPNQIGGNAVSANEFYNGYFSEIYFIDGQQLTPSSFGASNASGVWYPIPYTGSYGTNGFYLKFGNASSLGTDSSPNGNNFTVNNLTSVDQSTDSTLNNFATINTLTCNDTATLTSADGNLTITGGNDMGATIGITKGKWYWESKRSNTGTAIHWGVAFTQSWNSSTQIVTGNGSGIWIRNDFSGGYNTSNSGSNGFTTISGSTSGSSIANGDIVGIALDLDSATKSITFYQNGSQVGSGTFSYDGTTTFCTPFIRNNSGAQSQWNFGSPPYAANGFADGAGYGNFSYAVPSGYYALCTANLNTYG